MLSRMAAAMRSCCSGSAISKWRHMYKDGMPLLLAVLPLALLQGFVVDPVADK